MASIPIYKFISFLCHHHYHKASYKFKNYTYIHTSICVDVKAGLIHDAACASTGKGRSTQKPKWSSQENRVDTLFEERPSNKTSGVMERRCILVDSDTYISLLHPCTDIKALKRVHAHMLIRGMEENAFLGAKLVNMYVNCRSLEDARLAFDGMLEKNVFSYNAMIGGYARDGQFPEALKTYYEMQGVGIQPNSFTFPNILRACAALSALEEGKEIHYHIVRTGIEANIFVEAALVDMYAKCGSIENARHVFDKMSERNVVSWTAMIAGYAQNGYANEALTLFQQMQLTDVMPDFITIVSLVSACTHLGDLQLGKCIHKYIIRSGFEADVSVGSSLVAMYSKCGSVDMARWLFDKMHKRDVVSWNALIAGHTQNGHADEALTLFHQMQLEYVKPNTITMLSVLPACGHLGPMKQGKWIHVYIITHGFDSNVSIGTALIDMYAKWCCIEISQRLFDKMPVRNVISWSAMIAGYAQNGYAHEALTLFDQMQQSNVKPNSITMVSVLLACAHVGALQQGKWIHEYIIANGFETDVFVGTGLIDMYAKCGSLDNARQVFDKMSERSVVSWSAMISGYGMHGYGEDALAIFSKMQHKGMKPDHITFICLLSACSHAGLVDEGWQCFYCMSRDYCITPRVEHYACMVDLLGRLGHLDEAQDFIKKMPLEPDAAVWGALLGACRIYCNIDLGERVAERLFELKPEIAGPYVLLSNIYAAAGRWDDVENVRTMMKDRRVKKPRGSSFIEVNNKVHEFHVGDRSHPQSEKVYAILETLIGQMKEVGYVPNTNCVLHDVEEEVKENMLYSHSEKLAIAFGLINTKPGIPIQITKNLRVCGDCHCATKFISKIVRREIIVRDVNRFHHFKDGLCSCGDYW
eukprot:Gb_35190 [translate_table: standard]